VTSAPDDRSLGELFAELSQQTTTLVQKEIQLARHEITASASSMARHAALVGAGAALAYAGLIVVLIGVAWLLAAVGLPIWLTMLVVGGVAAGIGAYLAMRYVRAMRQESVVPERTIQTVKDDAQLVKDQTR
jgi:hypothetical protein